MQIFALSDPHLSFSSNKPMDIFGPKWERHAEKIAERWRETVTADDLVLVPGDISWAMKLPDAKVDLKWLADLPGQKVLIRGNHDYWWSGISKIRKLSPPTLRYVQHDMIRFGPIAIGGTRLWDFPDVRWPSAVPPGSSEFAEKPQRHADSEDEKIRERELGRLRLSLKGFFSKDTLRLCMVHYPPVGEDGQPTDVARVIADAGVDVCVYGHLHSLPEKNYPGADCVIGQTRFVLVSCDWLDFTPKNLNLPV